MTRLMVLALLVIGVGGGLDAAAAQTSDSQKPFVQRLQLTLTTEDSAQVRATCLFPSVKTPPAVLLVHDWGGHSADWEPFAQQLADHGIAAMMIDFRGQGESSEGKAADLTALVGNDSRILLNDIRAGIRYLREREDLDGVRVGLMGAGYGATAAACYAVDDHLLSALVLLSPSLEQHGLRTDDAVHGYGKRPSLVMAAKDDGIAVHSMPIIQTKASGPCTTLRVDGAASGIAMLADEQNRTKIIEWLDGVFNNP
jgi:dienelactone hydrolase